MDPMEYDVYTPGGPGIYCQLGDLYATKPTFILKEPPKHSIESRTGRVKWRLWTPKLGLPTTNPMASPTNGL